jgi:hypothetical protein
MGTLDQATNKGILIGMAASAALGQVLFSVLLGWSTPAPRFVECLLVLSCIGAFCGAFPGAVCGGFAGMWLAHHFRAYDPRKPYLDRWEMRAGRLCGAALGGIAGFLTGSIVSASLWEAGLVSDGGIIGKCVPALRGNQQLVCCILVGLGGLCAGAILGGRVGARSDRRAAAIAGHGNSRTDPAGWARN